MKEKSNEINNADALNEFTNDLLKLFDKKIYLINDQYKIVYTNALPNISSEYAEDDRNKSCYKLIFNSDTPCKYCTFSFLKSNDLNEIQNNFQKKYIRIKNHMNKETLHQDFSLTQTILNKNNEFFYVDIIDVNKNESMYDAGDQLTTLGAHVQTVAHELSNPITGLNLTRQQIAKILDSSDTINSRELKPLVNLLLKDIRRAAGVLSEIRNYSRPVNKSYKLVDLKTVLKSAFDNVSRIYESTHIKTAFQWDADENYTIAGNAAKLEQCFINIIKNSFEMFNLQNNFKLNEVKVLAEKTDTAGMIKIQIIDNAGGISNDALINVFKPYFTTKERFRGLGLGLYIASKILKEHHSTISIESIDDKTMVTIYMNQQENSK
ncbi:MAG: HAMP domain-containing histidine kinase [Spirochaetia bacterium]|nr:HAMP domain-containing histidine kinase [Spirochaetia bacterium]